MDSQSAAPAKNHLLAALSASDLALLTPHLSPIGMKLRQILEEPNRPIRHVFFMEQGIASVVATGDRNKQIEVGVIGRESMSGHAVVMGSDRSPHSTFIQVAGRAQRIGVQHFRAAMAQSSSLARLFLKAAQAFMVQTAHTAVANGQAKLEERLARWLLMAHDRLDGDQLPLTHEFLAIMLGVRRAGVTVALHELEGRSLIRTNRGHIEIREREGLEEIAGAFYGTPEKELDRLMGERR